MWSVELHCHTHLSPCGNLSPETIIGQCQKNNIDAIAITDHDTIQGAKEVQKKAPKELHVIIAAEISTQDGEMIGYFLQEDIPKELSVAETIERIKRQGGLVSIPHPGDWLRRKAMPLHKILPHIKNIDMIEVFNSRNMLFWNNIQAEKFAAQYNLKKIVASDAHFKKEIGKSTVSLEPFQGAQDFLQKISAATFEKHHSWPDVHVSTVLNRLKQKRTTER